jgi:hypothetical protein
MAMPQRCTLAACGKSPDGAATGNSQGPVIVGKIHQNVKKSVAIRKFLHLHAYFGVKI